MFSVDERRTVRDALAARARSDAAVVAAAVIGSAAAGAEDAWSDIDLALRLAPDADVDAVRRGWTRALYGEHGAVHHVDMAAWGSTFRVFLLESTLQVDLSFWTGETFLVAGHALDPVFGDVGRPGVVARPAPEHLAGMGWLYALHVRSAIERGRRWQAVHMLNGMREQVVGLACLRGGLPVHEGRGVDRLPGDVTDALVPTLVRDVTDGELRRAFAATTALFLSEVAVDRPELAGALTGPVGSMVT